MVKTSLPMQQGRITAIGDCLQFSHQDWDLMLIAINRIIDTGRLKVTEYKKAE